MGYTRGRPILRPVISAALVCATIAVAVMLLENQMIYFPTRHPDGYWDAASLTRGSGCLIEDRFFTTDDGVRLHGWLCRPLSPAADPQGAARAVLLWFHGNAGNLSHRIDMLLRLAALPAEVLIIDYRGYGRSQGRPSEHGLYRDAAAAWRHLTVERGVPAERIVIFGKSLGGAVAVDLAARVDPAGLVVQSSFSSVRDMARHHFPFIPTVLIRTRMDSAAKIGTVRCRKLFVHSPRDEIVPYRLGRRLYDAAPEPKRFLDVPGASHNDTWLVGGSAYFEALRRFISECVPPPSGR